MVKRSIQFFTEMFRSHDYFWEIHFIAENFSRTLILTAIFPEWKRHKTVTTLKYIGCCRERKKNAPNWFTHFYDFYIVYIILIGYCICRSNESNFREEHRLKIHQFYAMFNQIQMKTILVIIWGLRRAMGQATPSD